jgi:hypothetical protein
VEITSEEEAQIHALSDAELAAVFAFVEAAEATKYNHPNCGILQKGDQLENAELFGPYTIVQQLLARLCQLDSVQNPKGKADSD